MNLDNRVELEKSFIEFAEAFELARAGDASKLYLEGDLSCVQKRKHSLLELDGCIIFTLTKHGNVFINNDTWCQFRVWVRRPYLHAGNGRHVDGGGDGQIFNELGHFNDLKSLAEKYLIQGRYMMEDHNYVTWI